MKTNSTPQSPNTKGKQSGKSGSLLNTKDPLLRKVIAYLRLHHHLNAAFLISKQIHGTESHIHFPKTKSVPVRRFTYTLFIITDQFPRTTNDQNPARIMDELYNHTEKQARVYLIPYTAAAVAEKVDYGNNFLVGVLQAARCVYSVDDWWVRFKNFKVNHHPQIVDRISDHWDTRFDRATYLHSITGTIDVTENPAANFEVLQNVLKQACLGLIYLFWEYKPSYTGLPYLLHLCGHFADFPGKLFHTHTYQNHMLFYHLCRADHHMKFKVQTHLSLKQADKAWRKCETFLEKAHVLAEQRLEVLHRESKEHVSRVSGKRE